MNATWNDRRRSVNARISAREAKAAQLVASWPKTHSGIGGPDVFVRDPEREKTFTAVEDSIRRACRMYTARECRGVWKEVFDALRA